MTAEHPIALVDRVTPRENVWTRRGRPRIAFLWPVLPRKTRRIRYRRAKGADADESYEDSYDWVEGVVVHAGNHRVGSDALPVVLHVRPLTEVALDHHVPVATVLWLQQQRIIPLFCQRIYPTPRLQVDIASWRSLANLHVRTVHRLGGSVVFRIQNL